MWFINYYIYNEQMNKFANKYSKPDISCTKILVQLTQCLNTIRYPCMSSPARSSVADSVASVGLPTIVRAGSVQQEPAVEAARHCQRWVSSTRASSRGCKEPHGSIGSSSHTMEAFLSDQGFSFLVMTEEQNILSKNVCIRSSNWRSQLNV